MWIQKFLIYFSNKKAACHCQVTDQIIRCIHAEDS